MSMTANNQPRLLRSLVPARLDRLAWSPFHTRLVIALGVAWVLDGLEITLAGSVTGVLGQVDTLHQDRLVKRLQLRRPCESACSWASGGLRAA